MGPDALTIVFWMLSFKPTFSLFSFTFIKRLRWFYKISTQHQNVDHYSTQWAEFQAEHLVFQFAWENKWPDVQLYTEFMACLDDRGAKWNMIRKLMTRIWESSISSVHFSLSVVSNSLWPHKSQHTRPPCPSPTPGVHSNTCPWSWWCHPAISSSVIPFSSCHQSLPASESFPMSQLFTWGGQSIGVSASAPFLPVNI